MTIHKVIRDCKPAVVVVDPITNLISVGAYGEVKSMLTRLFDFLKTDQITTLFTSLTCHGDSIEQTDVGISSLIDTWICSGTSRSTASATAACTSSSPAAWPTPTRSASSCSTNDGIDLVDVYRGADGVLTGSARRRRRPRSGPTTCSGARADAEATRAGAEAPGSGGPDRRPPCRTWPPAKRSWRNMAEARGREAQVQSDQTEMARHRKADLDGAGMRATDMSDGHRILQAEDGEDLGR